MSASTLCMDDTKVISAIEWARIVTAREYVHDRNAQEDQSSGNLAKEEDPKFLLAERHWD